MSGISERLDSPDEQQRRSTENYLANLRVAMPGEIVRFDPSRQTATVRPLITENVQIDDEPVEAVNLPLLQDVPVKFPRAGGFCITFPVKGGDECLIVFCDMCIDGWWQSGGVQNQMETRRHDLSDATALLGISSIPNAIKDFSTTSAMFRNESKSTYIEIRDDGSVNINVSGSVNIKATGAANISAPTINLN